MAIEATKGINGYYLISDGGTMSLPHAHPHAVFPAPPACPADEPRLMVADLIAILGEHRLRAGGCGQMKQPG